MSCPATGAGLEACDFAFSAQQRELGASGASAFAFSAQQRELGASGASAFAFSAQHRELGISQLFFCFFFEGGHPYLC